MNTKRTVFIGGGIVLLLLIIASVACVIYQKARNPRIAFYGISEREAAAIQAVLGDAAEYQTFDTNESLYYQIKKGKKPDSLITYAGAATQTAIGLAAKTPLDATVLEGITSSVRSSAGQDANGAVTSVPILSSHFEIDINTDMLHRTGIQTIATWEDIEAFARAAQKNSNAKITFAGKDGATVLDLLGSLAEALHGRQAYDAAVQVLENELNRMAQQETAFNADALAQLLVTNDDSPLYDAVMLLKKWQTQGLLSTDSFSIDKNTLGAFMQNGMVSVAFMSLADHRTYDRAAIEPYTSIYFPSDYPAATRSFTAPITFVVPITKNKKALALIKHIVSVETQENLSRATGLAPALARCRTPDRQADDARYWVAATNTPLAGLSREVTLSDTQLQELGLALGVLVRFGN